MPLKSISSWKKFFIFFLVFEVLIIVVDFIVAYNYGLVLRNSADWLFGNNDIETFGSLLFYEGAILVGIGSIFAAGFSENVLVSKKGPSTWIVVEKTSKDYAEFREKQISAGFLLIIIGIPLIIFTIILML